MNEITCRRLGPEDVGLLNGVSSDVFDHPLVPESAEAFLRQEGHHLVAALAAQGEAARVIGFVSAVEVHHPDQVRPELFINEVGVAEPYRRRGIGRRLMEATLQIGRARGCRGAWLALDEHDEAALALYRSVGGAAPERQLHVDFGYPESGDGEGTG